METPKKKIGMYGETPCVKIGKFSICRQTEDGDTLWIEKAGGEGMEIREEIVERDMGWMHIPVDGMDEAEAEVDEHLGELKKLSEKYPYDATEAIEAAQEQWDHIDDGW